ncbi:unnamed protein product [Didymodactylos carnosus]|uniref:EF-hand domain-containing protein n=1 Tax=Didymodactylos carnosus TaxID=1234261 RepID=A0A8S2UGI2_9BILA|nr:unnamed protein product [Didymodactylos carnosus]
MPQFSLSEQIISNYCTETGFTEQEVVYAYATFMRDCPTGRCSRSQFEYFFRKSQTKHIDRRTKKFFNMMFSIYDINKDGEIDFKEYLYALSAATCANRLRLVETLFEFFDTDKNGFITRNEFEKKKKLASDFLHLESNEKAVILAFRTMDTDNDGLLTKEEFIQWHLQQGSFQTKTIPNATSVKVNRETCKETLTISATEEDDNIIENISHENRLETSQVCSTLVQKKKIKKLKETKIVCEPTLPMMSDVQEKEIDLLKITHNNQSKQTRTKAEKLRKKTTRFMYNFDQIKNVFSNKMTMITDSKVKKEIVTDQLKKEKLDGQKHRNLNEDKEEIYPINAWLNANTQADINRNWNNQDVPLNIGVNNHLENRNIDDRQHLSFKENSVNSTTFMNDIDHNLFRIFRKVRNRFRILNGISDNTSSIRQFKSTDSGILTASVYSTTSKSCSSSQFSTDSNFYNGSEFSENDLHNTNENMTDLFDMLEKNFLQILFELRQQNQSDTIIHEHQDLNDKESIENKFNDAVNNSIDNRILLQRQKNLDDIITVLSNNDQKMFTTVSDNNECQCAQFKTCCKNRKDSESLERNKTLSLLNINNDDVDNEIKIYRL